MSMTYEEFRALLQSGAYYALRKKDDANREDIRIRREDGRPDEIPNYPYRNNQIPAYIFDALLRGGFIEEDGVDALGGRIFRATKKRQEDRAA